MNIKKNLTQLIGNTPMMELNAYGNEVGAKGRIAAKLEYFNPTGSAKDRPAYQMVIDAENNGLLKPGATIIEPTSGNTGVGLASVAAARGYRAIIVMPDSMSVERRKLIAAFGAEIVLTPGADGMQGSIDKAEELAAEIPGSFIPNQFSNPSNSLSHYKTTGPEIWRDSDGTVDIFVASVGTGGTVTGTGRYLKEQNPDVKVVAVEPASSPLLTKGYFGSHKIQGIGANFVPEILDTELYDEVMDVEDDAAFEETKRAARTEGLLVGISSGAVLAAVRELAARDENSGKLIVALLTDTGERYLSTQGFVD